MMYISAAITNKVLNVLENGIFLSQARKTKHDKEMVFIRTERKGILWWISSQSKLLLARNALLFSKSFVVNLKIHNWGFF